MTMNRDRRNFLSRGFFEIVSGLMGDVTGTGINSSRPEDDYFDSFESCYPLLSEAGDMLIEEAVKKGLDIEGKSKLTIARELFQSVK